MEAMKQKIEEARNRGNDAASTSSRMMSPKVMRDLKLTAAAFVAGGIVFGGYNLIPALWNWSFNGNRPEIGVKFSDAAEAALRRDFKSPSNSAVVANQACTRAVTDYFANRPSISHIDLPPSRQDTMTSANIEGFVPTP